MHFIPGALGVMISVSHAASALAEDIYVDPQCKCFPGDDCWPSEQEWDAFNTTVGGRLIKTVPLASPCHDPDYDEVLCDEIKSQWHSSPIHINSSSSIQAPIFANASCDPFTPQTSACLLGNYVSYSVRSEGPVDMAATLRFARHRNIRLVIRNTGHDYMGRSTGAGALSIWTHHLKDIQLIREWSDAGYTGKAVKIGAGVEGHELLGAVAEAGLVAVTGECPTVGVAGGYIQNGGHSPLSTALGLGADQTLGFEVVTADGQLLTASPSQNPDLFWALSGSGAGNYGVVVSVTVKAHPDALTSGAGFVVDQPGLDYSLLLDTWHAALPDILDAGTMATYYATNATLVLWSLTGYNRTKDAMAAALAPFIASAAATAGLNISVQPAYTSFPSYHAHYASYYGPLPAGHFGTGTVGGQLIGGRFLPRGTLPRAGAAINAALLRIGGTFIGQAVNVSRFASPARAVHAQWRRAAVMSAYSLQRPCGPGSAACPLAALQARQDRITAQVMPPIEAVTPGAGAYSNEADFQQPGWQDVFFGGNYGRLAEVKARYDPGGLFWNAIAVGSEGWEVRRDGRLCRVDVDDSG